MVIKKEYYVYGNRDYPRLKHWKEKVVEQFKNKRITEKRFEYLSKEYGYEPAPEVAITRKLQVKFIFWFTIKKVTYKIDTNILCREILDGEYSFKKDWIKHKLWKIH